MKVAIYCRLSEEDRNKESVTIDSESIQNQKRMLIEYALKNSWDIYNIYSDDDYTGADRNRPEFNKLLADAEERKFDIILCKTQSRFTRELEIVEKYIHGLFLLWNIRFISIVDNADTNDRGNKKARQINGLINEWYLEDLSENIKSVFEIKRKDGIHIGSFALYGYMKDPNQKGHLIIDEEAANVVKEVFTLFSRGYGKTAIAKILNERGIPNPTEYKRLKGLRYQQPKQKNSTLWKYFAISNMLTNEIYIGNMVQGKYGTVSYKIKKNKPKPKEQWYRVEETHEPIIDMDLWNRVQRLVDQKAKPFIGGTIGLFAKKAKCMYCGYTMRSSKNHGKHYLRCSSRHISKEACVGSFIAVDKLEQAVITELNNLSNEYLDVNTVAQNLVIKDDFLAEQSHLKFLIETYNQKFDEYTKAMRDLYMDKVKGIITEADFLVLNADFSKQKDSLREQIEQTYELQETLQTKIDTVRDKKTIINEYINFEKLNREIVEKLINYVEIGKKDPVTKRVSIKIYWNF